MGDGRIQDAMTDTTSGAQAADQMQQSAQQGDWESAAAPAAQPPAQAQQPSSQAQPPTQTQPTTPAQPAAAPVSPIVLEKQHSPLGRVVESVLDSLTGTTRPVMATDAQGNKYVQQQTLTGTEKWERVAGELLSGAAKGLAAGKGAGNFGRAAAAGVDEGAKIAQQRQEETPKLTDEAQKQNLANANYQMLRMNMIEQTWKAARLKTEATQHDIDFAQGQEARLTKPLAEGGDGGVLLGTAEHPADIARILKADPNVVENMIKNHQIEVLPHYNEDGTPGGNRFFKMPDGYRSTMLPAGSTFHTFDSSTGQYIEHKASDPMTAGERDDYETAAGVKAQKFKNDQTELDLKTQQAAEAKANAESKAKETPSVIDKNEAEASKARAEKTLLNTASDQQTINSNAQQLVEGNVDPANLSKRSKTYDATLAAANAYSLATSGEPFDVAKAAGDYKFATNPQTYNTLNYLNSLTGRDGKSGNLGLVVTMSNGLHQTNFPALNDAAQWAKLATGNPQIAAYHAALLETQDQVAKILQGGNNGATTDAKLKQANELMDKGFSGPQMSAVGATLQQMLGNRKTEMIGTNRYLKKWQTPQTPAGMVTVQIPGSPAGQIPASALDKFQADHPNAVVTK
jgi:hypothetical protein